MASQVSELEAERARGRDAAHAAGEAARAAADASRRLQEQITALDDDLAARGRELKESEQINTK